MLELFNLCNLSSVVVLIFVLFQQIRNKHTTFSIRKSLNACQRKRNCLSYHFPYNHALLFSMAYLRLQPAHPAAFSPSLSWAFTTFIREWK